MVRIGEMLKSIKEYSMPKKFERYDKYCVFKWSDFSKYLGKEKQKILGILLNKIEEGRISREKKLHRYVVVNQELPYAEQVWKLIQEYWEKKSK